MKEGHIPRSLLELEQQQLLDLVHLSRKMRMVWLNNNVFSQILSTCNNYILQILKYCYMYIIYTCALLNNTFFLVSND